MSTDLNRRTLLFTGGAIPLGVPDALAARDDARLAAYMALVGTGTGFDTLAEMLASTITYGSQSIEKSGVTATLTLAAGDVLFCKETGVGYRIGVSGATDAWATTSGGLTLYPMDGAQITSLGNFKTPVYATPTQDSSRLVLSALSDATVLSLNIPAGTWRFDNEINQAIDRSFSIHGAPNGGTKIVLNHLGHGINLSTSDTNQAAFDKTAVIENLTVTRPGASSASLREVNNLALGRFRNPILRNIDSSQHTGWGTAIYESYDPLFDNVKSHDALTSAGAGRLAGVGTDGMDAYHCTRPRFVNCSAWSVGDDGISIGSLNNSGTRLKTTDAFMSNCYAYDCAGAGHKLYGHVSGFTASDITANYCYNGGFMITDHGEDEDFVIEDILLNGGLFINCNDAPSAAIRLRFTGASSSFKLKNLVFNAIHTIGCRGVAFFNSASKTGDTVSNITFSNVVQESPSVVSGGGALAGISIASFSGHLNIINALLYDSLGEGVSLLAASYDNISRLVMRDVVVDGFNMLNPDTNKNGVQIPISNVPVDIDGLTVRNQNRNATTQPARSLNITSVTPDSQISGFVMDASSRNASISGSYRSTDPVSMSSIPTTGTFELGDYVRSTSASQRGWRCTSPGTFGTLSGVTYSGTSGQYQITVSSTSGLYVGQYLSGNWSGGYTRVSQIVDSTTVMTQGPLTADVSSATLNYKNPTLTVD